MGDRLLAALVIAAAAVLIGAVMWALYAYTRRLDGKPDTPTPTRPGQADPEPVCGGHGPAGMRCDRPPHDAFERCEENGIGWWSGTKPIDHGWWLDGGAR